MRPPGRTLRALRMPIRVFAAAVAVGLASPAGIDAQDACPAAGGPDAEAGWAAYRAGDTNGARAAFGRALELCPGLQYARTGLGYVALREGDEDTAAGLFRVVVGAVPDDVDALVGLGLVAWRAGDAAEVRRRFERVLDLEPGHPTAVDYLARVEAAANARDPADQAWAEGDVDRAVDLYSDRVEADPTDGTALLRLGQAYSWREEYGAALSRLDRLLELEPDHLDGRVARARVYSWTGDVSRAIREVESVLAAEPDHAEALSALATFRSWEDRAEGSIEVDVPLVSISPGDASFRRQAGRMPAGDDQTGRSIAAWRERLAQDPTDVDARLGLARSLAFAGEYAASVAEYDTVAAAAPGDVRAQVGRATTLRWNGRLDASEAAALQATGLDPTSGAAWSALGLTYRAQGRSADALEAFTTAQRLAPSDAEIRDQLRTIRRSLRPAARPTFTGEDDSDGNRMLTTALVAGWHPVPRLEVDVRGWHKRLEQEGVFPLERTVLGATVTGRYQLGPGWLLTGSAGGFGSDRGGDDTFLSGSAMVRSPDRHPFGFTVALATTGLDETAALVERGVRSTSGTLAARWRPDGLWRLDGSLTLGSYEGSVDNGRRGWALGASRRVGSVTLGLAHRGFSFEQNVNDGYFDPDYYGIVELAGYWLLRPGAWRFLVELAPGVEQVRTDGDPTLSLRSRLRVGYVVDPLREVSFSIGYSDAGLSRFATGADGYRYVGVTLGVDWVF